MLSNQISYFIDKDVCYLTMCDAEFSKRTAFSYLEELASQFFADYGNKINSVARPYSFIEFGKPTTQIIFHLLFGWWTWYLVVDTQIQKIKKQYLDSRKSNFNRINTELQEVHKILAQNIEDVLQRGDALRCKIFT